MTMFQNVKRTLSAGSSFSVPGIATRVRRKNATYRAATAIVASPASATERKGERAARHQAPRRPLPGRAGVAGETRGNPEREGHVQHAEIIEPARDPSERRPKTCGEEQESRRREHGGARHAQPRSQERRRGRREPEHGRQPARRLPREKRQGQPRMPRPRVEPELPAQHLPGPDPDAKAPRRLGRHVAGRVFPGDGVAGEHDAAPRPRHARRDEEVVHRGRVPGQRRDELAPGGVNRAVGSEADTQLPFRFLGPRFAVPVGGLGRRARTGRGFELEPAAHRAHRRIPEAPAEGLERAGLENGVGIGEDENVGGRGPARGR